MILLNMKNFLAKFYFFIKTIPDMMYPFATDVGGHIVRGRQSYSYAVEQAWEKYGPNHMGYKLAFYRGIFHFLGSVIMIVLFTVISQHLFGSEIALYLLVSALIIGLSLQEFYFHPKYYAQSSAKGIADWLTWVVPMMAFLFLF